jgi:hypothetical protein
MAVDSCDVSFSGIGFARPKDERFIPPLLSIAQLSMIIQSGKFIIKSLATHRSAMHE